MAKFSQVLFTSDFDHTLTGSDSVVPKANVEAIEYFIANGGKFCLNSGRSVPLMRCRVHEIPTNAPCLCYNGAACYDYRDEKLIYANILPDFAPEIVKLVQDSGLNVCMEVQRFDNHYEIHRQLPARLKFLSKEGLNPVFCDENIPKPWMKLIVCGANGETVSERLVDIDKADFEAFLALQKRIDEFCAGRCYVTRSMPRLIEISNPDCNKGKAARALSNELGREILVCAGDAPNDEQMLLEANFAFCPSDADSSILQLSGIRQTAASNVGCVADAIAQLEKLL